MFKPWSAFKIIKEFFKLFLVLLILISLNYPPISCTGCANMHGT